MLGINKNGIANLIVVFSVLVLLAIVGGIGVLWYEFSDIRGRDHASDEELIRNLEKHSQQYQHLIAMFLEDTPASVIHPTWVNPENVISADRWAEYKVLFHELKLDAGIRSWGGDSIYFISTAQGLFMGGSSKGYMYKPETPYPLYPSLNKKPQDLKSNVMAYRKINKDWYIVFDWND